VNSKDVLAAALLLVGPPMLDKFGASCQTNRDSLALKFEGWAWG